MRKPKRETGQVVLVLTVLVLLAGLSRLPLSGSRSTRCLAPYTIGALAAFWTIQRTVASFHPGA